MSWNDPSIRHVLVNLARSAVASMEYVKGEYNRGNSFNFLRTESLYSKDA